MSDNDERKVAFRFNWSCGVNQAQEAACLRYDFDADSKGDSDCKVFSTRMVTAAKDYPGQCFPCLGDIVKGERHRAEIGLMDGRMRTCRTCATCCEAMAACRLDDDFDRIESRYTLGRERADKKAAAV